MTSEKGLSDDSNLKNEYWLRKEYQKGGRTQEDIAEEFGVTSGTVRYYIRKYGIEPPEESYKPWKDPQNLHEEYIVNEKNSKEMGELWNVSDVTVLRHLEENGIERRDAGYYHSKQRATFIQADYQGYEKSLCQDGRVLIHRLLAVCEYGFEKVVGKDVHHLNEVPWDNRASNIELMTRSEHMKHHHG